MTTIKELIRDLTTPTGYRDKATGQFVSYKTVELFEKYMSLKTQLSSIEKEIENMFEAPDNVEDLKKQLSELESKYNDDEYQAPHEAFKIKYPFHDELSDRTLRNIAKGYFGLEDRTEIIRGKKIILKGHPRNKNAMEYTLVKLKMEQIQKQIDELGG